MMYMLSQYMFNPMFNNKLSTRTKIIGSFVFLLLVAGFVVDYTDYGVESEVTGAVVSETESSGFGWTSGIILAALGITGILVVMFSYAKWKKQK